MPTDIQTGPFHIGNQNLATTGDSFFDANPHDPLAANDFAINEEFIDRPTDPNDTWYA